MGLRPGRWACFLIFISSQFSSCHFYLVRVSQLLRALRLSKVARFHWSKHRHERDMLKMLEYNYWENLETALKEVYMLVRHHAQHVTILPQRKEKNKYEISEYPVVQILQS